MIISALLELGSIASLVPFLQKILFLEQERIIFFDDLLINFNFYQKNKFFVITSLFIGFILLSLLIKVALLKLTFNFTKIIGLHFSRLVIKKTLDLNYIKYTSLNSGDLVAMLETKIDRLVDFIYHSLEVLSSLTIMIFVFAGLLIVNTKISIITFFVLFICYFLMFKKYKKKMVNLGDEYAIGLSNRVKTIQEIFGSFRLLKIDKSISRTFFNKKFLIFDENIRSALAKLSFLGTFPRYFIEGIALIIISSMAFYLIKKEIYPQELIVLSLGVIAFSAQKLLPLAQKIYYSFSLMSALKQSVLDIVDFLEIKTEEFYFSKKKEFKFNNSIILKNIKFEYATKKNNLIFKNINLKIKKNSKVCVLGKTGSGKSTFVDLIVGLLQPMEGKVLVDETNIEDCLESWQNKISYVPQTTFLTDSTILENITFGTIQREINFKKLDKAIKLANLENMINKLPEKLQTKIGERGVMLSGGQIQRLGLARAFYRDFEILILDESTNALDSETEQKIYSNIKTEFVDKTIFSITHNRKLSKEFDVILELNEGKIEEKFF
ncbi:ATP-binding cassette domain-containing protein [Candidatus Pelagibacter sp.]|uniref:ATP-binding cassette domain-containing protein n=1 Tax=Candidatus Pelagibacter sp. TaxID=2024849 RepID=UPI003F855DE0